MQGCCSQCGCSRTRPAGSLLLQLHKHNPLEQAANGDVRAAGGWKQALSSLVQCLDDCVMLHVSKSPLHELMCWRGSAVLPTLLRVVQAAGLLQILSSTFPSARFSFLFIAVIVIFFAHLHEDLIDSSLGKRFLLHISTTELTNNQELLQGTNYWCPSVLCPPNTARMADNNQTDYVAVAALVIAVVALFAAISQIAQAIFASARGLPNCDERVIGQWALQKWHYRNGRIRPRLQEFRLEVFFEAPIIFLAPMNNIRKPGKDDSRIYVADGTEDSCDDYRIDQDDIPKPGDKEPVHTVDSENATWIWLLVAIQRMEKDSRRWEKEWVEKENLETLPAPEEPSLTIQMIRKQRSFDINPAMKKPFATTTISHVVELAAVLGLYWKVFDLEDNKYRAAGNGYSLVGSRIADFGIVFVFEKSSTPQFNSRRIIPTSEVKELCFGRLPTLYRRKEEPEDVAWQSVLKTSSGDKNLKLEVLQLGSREEIANTLRQIGCNATTTFYYRNEKKHEHLFPGKLSI